MHFFQANLPASIFSLLQIFRCFWKIKDEENANGLAELATTPISGIGSSQILAFNADQLP